MRWAHRGGHIDVYHTPATGGEAKRDGAKRTKRENKSYRDRKRGRDKERERREENDRDKTNSPGVWEQENEGGRGSCLDFISTESECGVISPQLTKTTLEIVLPFIVLVLWERSFISRPCEPHPLPLSSKCRGNRWRRCHSLNSLKFHH